MNQETMEAAVAAVRLYAETHPRPPHVTQEQAADMLRVGKHKVCTLVKLGVLRVNACGRIPTSDVDRALAVRAV
jgi:hypothetical protein